VNKALLDTDIDSEVLKAINATVAQNAAKALNAAALDEGLRVEDPNVHP
jgi:hypothetical protein